VQSIEAVEKRDRRKTKHQGFFVNADEASGFVVHASIVECMGDKPVTMRKRRRPLHHICYCLSLLFL
jgi:predicted short-subunit dehydrogenase-like oxidoreductase (DUF2520 family)